MSDEWASDQGKPYLTKEGEFALSKYSKRLDVLRPYCMIQTYQEELKQLNVNDVIIGPSFYSDQTKNLFKLTKEEKFIQIPFNDSNIKLIRKNFRIYDFSWFSWNSILYFTSWNLKKIEKLSIYYTNDGLNYLLQKRASYLFVRDNPHLFGANQVKAFKTHPIKKYC